jgi:hypothetical protein
MFRPKAKPIKKEIEVQAMIARNRVIITEGLDTLVPQSLPIKVNKCLHGNVPNFNKSRVTQADPGPQIVAASGGKRASCASHFTGQRLSISRKISSAHPMASAMAQIVAGTLAPLSY